MGICRAIEKVGARMNPYIFPVILVALDVAAAVVYATHGEWARVGYWVSAAMITVFATLI